ncbi:DUF6913 domain-containing protein [Flavobacterium aquatile]|uniref:Uncharacterized protein n=1 Tax=Flavobacterium aquatile LMG 4008 = ATCC 11947 TaxID=1453498 RepID=A0A095SSA0_9FLAO|nr:hypothetical protein [Flavobacterium aquatile]KGD67467.1 hypothetical protein LG45_14790 [Flavobacterium aquatile LMG 4008 = ATCC 11947]OXA67004.1 hypothetical protein B0A61_09680 [Flavobacterium aquatile LMG 4008 = ATCC 11947]GEC79942.1 hypothetical protein FAQ01_28120 [Flavobacterium aquatile]
MFLDKIKDFWTKKIVKKSLSNVKHNESVSSIKKIGIIIDESYFNEKNLLLNQLKLNGISEENIEILAFRNRVKKNETFDYTVFSYKDLSWNATFDKNEIIDFVNQNFDLLVSYYDVEKAPLLLVTSLSKANFKVGFANVDKRLNHFMIDTQAENYKVFIEELFKYLKILNKL